MWSGGRPRGAGAGAWEATGQGEDSKHSSHTGQHPELARCDADAAAPSPVDISRRGANSRRSDSGCGCESWHRAGTAGQRDTWRVYWAGWKLRRTRLVRASLGDWASVGRARERRPSRRLGRLGGCLGARRNAVSLIGTQSGGTTTPLGAAPRPRASSRLFGSGEQPRRLRTVARRWCSNPATRATRPAAR